MHNLLLHYRATIYQFSRFSGIGFLNTALDFVIINVLIAFTGITAGLELSVLKIISFSLAVIHSYFWNRSWAFGGSQDRFVNFLFKIGTVGLLGVLTIAVSIYGAGQKFGGGYFVLLALVFFVIEVGLWKGFGLSQQASPGPSGGQFSMFITISIIGAGLAATIVWIMTTYLHPTGISNPRLWANIANAVSTIIVLFWNFVGYKVFVFRK